MSPIDTKAQLESINAAAQELAQRRAKGEAGDLLQEALRPKDFPTPLPSNKRLPSNLAPKATRLRVGSVYSQRQRKP